MGIRTAVVCAANAALMLACGAAPKTESVHKPVSEEPLILSAQSPDSATTPNGEGVGTLGGLSIGSAPPMSLSYTEGDAFAGRPAEYGLPDDTTFHIGRTEGAPKLAGQAPQTFRIGLRKDGKLDFISFSFQGKDACDAVQREVTSRFGPADPSLVTAVERMNTSNALHWQSGGISAQFMYYNSFGPTLSCSADTQLSPKTAPPKPPLSKSKKH